MHVDLWNVSQTGNLGQGWGACGLLIESSFYRKIVYMIIYKSSVTVQFCIQKFWKRKQFWKEEKKHFLEKKNVHFQVFLIEVSWMTYFKLTQPCLTKTKLIRLFKREKVPHPWLKLFIVHTKKRCSKFELVWILAMEIAGSVTIRKES